MKRIYQKPYGCYAACIQSLLDIEETPEGWIPTSPNIEAWNIADKNIKKYLREVYGLFVTEVLYKHISHRFEFYKALEGQYIMGFYGKKDENGDLYPDHPLNHVVILKLESANLEEDGSTALGFNFVHDPAGPAKQPRLEAPDSFYVFTKLLNGSFPELEEPNVRILPNTIPDGSSEDPFNLDRYKTQGPSFESAEAYSALEHPCQGEDSLEGCQRL